MPQTRRARRLAAQQQSNLFLRLSPALLGKVWPPERLLHGCYVNEGIQRELLSLMDHVHWQPVSLPLSDTMPGEIELGDDVVSFCNWIPVESPLSLVERCEPPYIFGFGIARQMVHLEFWAKPLSISASAVAFRFPDSWSRSLVHLDLSSCGVTPDVADKLAEALGECSALQHLDLSDNLISDENGTRLAAMIGGLKDLRFFDLSSNDFQDFSGPDRAGLLLEALAGCHQLSELNLQCLCGVYAADVAQLHQCSNLTMLDLSYEGNAAPSHELDLHEKIVYGRLTELRLHFTHLEDDGVARFSSNFSTLSSLRFLDLSCCLFGDEGATALAQALPLCTNLNHVELGGNDITDRGAGELANYLLTPDLDLHILSLWGGHIGPEGGKLLWTAALVSSTLQDLDLSSGGRKLEGSVHSVGGQCLDRLTSSAFLRLWLRLIQTDPSEVRERISHLQAAAEVLASRLPLPDPPRHWPPR